MHSVPTGCEWRYEARAQTVDGRLLPEPGAPLQCNRVAGGEKKLCTDTLRIEQAFEGCTGSPDRLSLTLSGYAPAGSRVEVERGPADAPVHVGMFVVPPSIDGSFSETMVADVHGEPEGGMPVRGRILSPNPQPGEVPVTAEISAVVDRTPPEAELLLPPDGGLLCASPATGDTISFQVLANDDRSPWLEVHARARPVGGGWSALARTCEEGDTECAGGSSRIPPRRPIALEWGAFTLAAGDHESETTFCDQSGNATRIPRSFSLLRQPRPRVVSVSRRLFSPNGDGQADETVMTVRLAQAGQLTVRVHAGAEGGAVVRTLSEQFQTASDVAIAWDGRADSGQTAPDGPYTVVFSVTDPCGGTGEVAISVEIDTVPPEVAITDPAPGQRVSASVDVKGLATDAHFGSWELDLACASEPWSRLDSRPSPVSVGGFLAGWDTSRAPPGECRLRLTARDAALNRSPEAVVAVRVERGDLILRLTASPDVFSPNGDGRRETTTLEYELQRRARVRLQVRDHQGRPLRTVRGRGRARGRRPELRLGRPQRRERAGRRGRSRPVDPGRGSGHALGLRGEDDPARPGPHATGDRDLASDRRLVRAPPRDGPRLDHGPPPGRIRDHGDAGWRRADRDRPCVPGADGLRPRRAPRSGRGPGHAPGRGHRPRGERGPTRPAVRGRLDPAARGHPVPARRGVPAPRGRPDRRHRSRGRRPPRGVDAAVRHGGRAGGLRDDRPGPAGRERNRRWAVGRAVRPGRPLHAQPGRDRPGGLVDRVPHRRHPRRPPAHGRTLPPARRRLRDRARPDRGNGHRRQTRFLGARVGAGRGRDRLPVGARRGGPRRRRGGHAGGVVTAAARRRLHAAAHRARQGRAQREHAGDRDRRHDATGEAHRPAGEGHEGARGLRPRRGDLEREHRARSGRLSHLARRRWAGVGPPPAAGLGRRRADRGSLRLLGRGGRQGWQREPAGAAPGPRGPHAPERGLPLAAAGRLGVGRGGGAGHGPQRRRLRGVPPVRGRGRVADVLESPAALLGPRRGEPPWRVAGARRRPVRPRARGRRHARQPRPGHPARRGRHPAPRPARARRGGPSRHADRPARPEVGAEPLGRRGRLPRLPQRAAGERGRGRARGPARLPGAGAHPCRRRAPRRASLLPRRGPGRSRQRVRGVERDLRLAGQPSARRRHRRAPRPDAHRLRRPGRGSNARPGRGAHPVRAESRRRRAVARARRAGVDPGPADPAVGGDARPRRAAPRAGRVRPARRRHGPGRPDRPHAGRHHGDVWRHDPASRAHRPRRAGGRAGRLPRLDAGHRAGPGVLSAVPRRRADRAGPDRAAARRPRPGSPDLRVRRDRGGRGRERERPERPRRGRCLRGAPRGARLARGLHLFRLGERRRFPAPDDGAGPPRGRGDRGGSGNRRERSGWTACRWSRTGIS